MVYRVGIIGFGIMGQRMHANMVAHPDFEVTAVFDPAGVAAGVSRVSSAAEIVGHAGIDLVYIACPPAWHAEHALAAAAAGKPVFCEKPLAVDLAESRRMVTTFKDAGVPNAVNFSFAANPSRAFIRQMLADGGFGSVEAIDIRLHFSRWPRAWQETAGWLGLRAQGGYVREVLSHFVYLTESIFGATSVQGAHLRYPDGPAGTAAESHVWAELACADIPVSVAGGVGGCGPDRIEYTVWGTRQSCRLDDWYTVSLSDGTAWRPGMTEVPDPRQAGRVSQLDNLARFMCGEPHELPDFRAALSVQETIEAVLG